MWSGGGWWQEGSHPTCHSGVLQKTEWVTKENLMKQLLVVKAELREAARDIEVPGEVQRNRFGRGWGIPAVGI